MRKIKLKIKNGEAGYQIIESMVAIGIITVGMVGIFGLMANSFAANTDLANRFTASYLAVEGVEVVKNLIDTNIVNSRIWNAGLEDGVYSIGYDCLSLSDSSCATIVSALPGENSAVGNPLIFNPETGIYSEQGTEGATQFVRNIKVENISDYEIKVVGQVTWYGRNNAATTINVEDHFFDWR